jgi:signal transduction histidine kinase
MRSLLADVLDLCLAGIGGLRLRPEALRLDELVRGAADRLERLASRREQALRVVAAGPVEVRADRRLLERVLGNLAGNAIQHGPPGQTIEVRVAARPGGGARCEVRDAGRAIAHDQRDQIFSAFERLPQPSSPTAGRGLGLAFCKLAVESHGGRIGVTPGEDEGNSFWFELPAAPPAAPAPAR